MASPAYLHCTGPIFVYSLDASGNPQQLGTCEQYPISQDDYSWDEVMNDIGGSMIGFDEQYMGQLEVFSLELNRFNIAVSSFEEAAPSPGSTITVPGFDNALSRGMFLNQNSQGFPLWLKFSFFGTANATPDLPIGVFYPNCRMIRASRPQQGTKTLKQTLQIMAFPDFSFVGGVWSFTVKTSDPSTFTAIAG